jgi:YggT family protein
LASSRRTRDEEIDFQDIAEAHHHVAVDTPATRNAGVFKLQQAIYLLFGIIEALIAIRFVLLAFGANQAAPFVSGVYAITAPFIAPFTGIFGTPRLGGSIFEPHSLVAIVMYALLAWVLAKLASLLLADTRADIRTSERTVHSAHEHEVDRAA